jgi:hypothetical protein
MSEWNKFSGFNKLFILFKASPKMLQVFFNHSQDQRDKKLEILLWQNNFLVLKQQKQMEKIA